ncbi:hypothetical protein ACFL17_06090 [Pseudomonadota bacterium]
MKHFPDFVQKGMRESDSAATCLPCIFDAGQWETAIFFRLVGPESKQDRRLLSRTTKPLPISLETDLIEADSAAVILLRVEALTHPDDPLIGEILLTPGESKSHFESIKLLASQPRLCWFFSDADFRVIHSQEMPLGKDHHGHFEDLLRDAVRHDALIRCTSQYNAQLALSAVVAKYEFSSSSEQNLVTPPGLRSQSERTLN